MTSIVHSGILRSKDFGSPFQGHTIRTTQSGMFSLCQTFEQLFWASCNSDGITSELSHFLTNPFPAGPTAFRGAANPVCSLPPTFALPSAYSVFPRSRVCLFLLIQGSPILFLFRELLPQGSGSTPLFPPSGNIPCPLFNLVYLDYQGHLFPDLLCPLLECILVRAKF